MVSMDRRLAAASGAQKPLDDRFAAMVADFWEYIARRPRHPVTATARLEVEVQRSPDKVPARIVAELLDLSRDGFQLRVRVPLVEQEAITVRLRDDTSELDLKLQGTVRWQYPRQTGQWLVGCAATRMVDWETLGEMFLSGILAVDDPKS